MKLVIHGLPVPPAQMHRFALRFVGEQPVLYHDGKRVVDAWSIELVAAVMPDRDGAAGGLMPAKEHP